MRDLREFLTLKKEREMTAFVCDRMIQSDVALLLSAYLPLSKNSLSHATLLAMIHLADMHSAAFSLVFTSAESAALTVSVVQLFLASVIDILILYALLKQSQIPIDTQFIVSWLGLETSVN